MKSTLTALVLSAASTAKTRMAWVPGDWRVPGTTDWPVRTGPLQSVAMSSEAKSGTTPRTPGATLVERLEGTEVNVGGVTSRRVTTFVAQAVVPLAPVIVVTLV